MLPSTVYMCWNTKYHIPAHAYDACQIFRIPRKKHISAYPKCVLSMALTHHVCSNEQYRIDNYIPDFCHERLCLWLIDCLLDWLADCLIHNLTSCSTSVCVASSSEDFFFSTAPSERQTKTWATRLQRLGIWPRSGLLVGFSAAQRSFNRTRSHLGGDGTHRHLGSLHISVTRKKF